MSSLLILRSICSEPNRLFSRVSIRGSGDEESQSPPQTISASTCDTSSPCSGGICLRSRSAPVVYPSMRCGSACNPGPFSGMQTIGDLSRWIRHSAGLPKVALRATLVRTKTTGADKQEKTRQDQAEKMTAMWDDLQSPERSFVWSFCPCCDRIFVVLAPFEGCDGAMVQPTKQTRGTNRRQRSAVARNSQSLCASAHMKVSASQGNYPTTPFRRHANSKKNRCAFASPHGPLL